MRTWLSCRSPTGSCGRCGSAATARSPRRRACAFDRVVPASVCAHGPDLAGGRRAAGVVHDLAGACRAACVGGRRASSGLVLAGPRAIPARGSRRVNGALTAVRGMVVHAVAAGQASGDPMAPPYEVADDRDLPVAARGEDGRTGWRMRARHRLHEPETPVGRASDEQIVALLRACMSARDWLIVLPMARAGLRRGELCGLRRSMSTCGPTRGRWEARSPARTLKWSRRRGQRRTGPGTKSPRRQRAGMLDFPVVQAFDTYALDPRVTIAGTAQPGGDSRGDHLLRGQVRRAGAARGRSADLLAAAPREPRSRLPRRHAATDAARLPQQRRRRRTRQDVVAYLLGHASMPSSQVYMHPDLGRAAAVDAVPIPRSRRGDPVPGASGGLALSGRHIPACSSAQGCRRRLGPAE